MISNMEKTFEEEHRLEIIFLTETSQLHWPHCGVKMELFDVCKVLLLFLVWLKKRESFLKGPSILQ